MAIATIEGVALSPGVSRNGRLYTRETIARAVARAQGRIADGVRPVSMRTHHAAGDDSTRLTGHLTTMTLDENGRARFKATIEGNDAGRSIATLADDRDGEPTLRGLSIRGYWLGPTRTVNVDGQPCETADDLEITGLDWTAEPGVDDAGVERIEFIDDGGSSSPEETVGGRHPITESAEGATVTITEERPARVAPNTTTETAATAQAAQPRNWADLGYHGGTRRWPLDTTEQACESWHALHDPGNLGGYTGPQVKRMRGRAKAALRDHGVTITTEGWLARTVPAAGAVTESGAVAEGWNDGAGSFSIRLSNGSIDVCVSSWYVDGAQLDGIARAAMNGAIIALAAIDPDGDGDPEPDGDGDVEAAETTAAPAAVVEATTQTPAAVAAAGATDPTTEEAAVSEPTTDNAGAATTAAPAITFTPDQFAQFLDRVAPPAATPAAVAAPVETAPVAPAVVEAAPVAAAAPAAGTDIARMVSEATAAAVAAAMPGIVAGVAQTIGQAYPPARRGLPGVPAAAPGVGVGESAAAGLPTGLAQKPLHTYDDTERLQLDRHIAGAVLGDRLAPAAGGVVDGGV